MDWTYDKKYLRETIALMMQLARADGNLDEREIQYIFDIGKLMQMPPADIELAISESEQIRLTVPTTEPERLALLYRLLFLMKIDNEVSGAEEQVILKTALRLGVRDSMVADMIMLMRENLKNRVPIEDMLAKIRRYLN